MENKGSDSQWKNAFDGAEVPPSEAVWSSIESSLIAAENTKMKRTIVLYQRLAAACVIVTLLGGGYAFFYGDSPKPFVTRPEIAANNPAIMTTDSLKKKQDLRATADAPENRRPSKGTSSKNELILTQRSGAVTDPATANTPAIAARGATDVTINRKATTDAMNQEAITFAKNRSAANDLALAGSVDGSKTVVVNEGADKKTLNNDSLQTAKQEKPFAASTPKFVASVTYDSALAAAGAESPLRIKPVTAIPVPGMENAPGVILKKESTKENMWASMGAATGVFNPGIKSSGAAANPNSSAGQANSFGFAVAGKVLPRWVIQGGVNYINQNSGKAGGNNNIPSTVSFSYDAFYKAAATGSYSLNSTMEFIALPVQAGYLIVDRKVGFQFNAGVSPTVFLRNTLQDGSGQGSTVTAGAGENSPYRTMSWSGLMSTELSYRLARQYRFSLVPGMRYSLNSTLKAGGDHPYVLDLGFRLRYSFR